MAKKEGLPGGITALTTRKAVGFISEMSLLAYNVACSRAGVSRYQLRYDYWENSTHITGVRVARIRMVQYYSPDTSRRITDSVQISIINETMGEIKAYLATLPDGSYKFLKYNCVVPNVFLMYYKSRKYTQ